MIQFNRKFLSMAQIAIILALCVLAGVQRSSAGNFGSSGNTTYVFTGACSDCTGNGVGYLTLQNGYPITTVNASNFVSFNYKSNLVTMNLTPSNVTGYGGGLPATIPGTATYFELDTNLGSWLYIQPGGTWCVSTSGGCAVPADQGLTSSWSLYATSVPTMGVPAEIALFGLLAALGVYFRRQLGSRTV